MYSQLIHGKFCGKNSGYRLIACTPDYENNTEFIYILFRKYHFWGPQGVGDGKAIGIFQLDANRLVLVKAALAEDENQQLLSSADRDVRHFYQHHYILADRVTENIELLETNPVDFLLRFLDRTSPYFADFNQPIYPHSANGSFWEQIISEIFQPTSSEITADRANKIKQFSDDIDNQARSFLLLTLGAILTGQKIILTIDNNASDPIDLVSNLLLLLPASYRTKIAISIGTVEENQCLWADIIIKTDQEPAYPLAEEFIWLDRDRKKVVGKHDPDIYNHRYLNDFVKKVCNSPEFIEHFIKHLNSLFSSVRNFTRDDLQQASSLIYFISGLPEDPKEAQEIQELQKHKIDLWCNYIAEIYENHSNTDYWQPIIDDFKDADDFWQALLKLFQEHGESFPIAVELILLVIQKVGIEQAYQKLEEVKQIEGLPSALIKIGLLNRFPSELENSVLNQHLVDICEESIKDIRDRYLVKDSVVEFDALINFLQKSNRYQRLFSSAKEKFELLSKALKPELSTKTIKSIFNQYLAIKLPYADEQFFNSDLYRQTLEKFFSIKNWTKYFTADKTKSFNYLPAIAQEMELNYEKTDLMYANFLDVFSPPPENTYEILIDIIKKAITFDISTEKDSNIELKSFPSKIKLFSTTYQWFKNNNAELEKRLKSLENASEKWNNWDALITFLKVIPMENILLVEDLLKNAFLKKSLLKWLKLLKADSSFKEDFFNSYSWNNIQLETISDLTRTEEGQWNKLLTCLVVERFTQEKERLVNVIPTLLNYLCQLYFQEKSISIEDRELWIRLIEPSFLKYLSNVERLNIFSLKWHLKIYSDFIITLQPLDDTQQKALYSIAKNKFDLVDNLNDKFQLFQDIYKYLAKDHLKKIAIDLIEFCSTPNEISSLVKLCQKFDFDNRDIKEILTKVKKQVCGYSLLDLLFSYLELEPIYEYDKKLIEMLFFISITNQEQNKKIGIFLRNYNYECANLKLIKLINDKLIEQQYLN